MLFLKVTKSVKGLTRKFGWLLAELVFVFLGMYGAFLLERMQDEENDILRKRQILQALVDEFENYESELGEASYTLNEAYCTPFFSKYANGKKPFPNPIPFGAMGSVNTGIWEAMLQSGGIEVLEVDLIQKVQGFFKKLQDLLDLYTRLERLSESMIMPEMDRDADFFYEKDGIALRDKYKWHVDMLYTINMFLGDLTTEAKSTKDLLISEFEKIKDKKLKPATPSSPKEKLNQGDSTIEPTVIDSNDTKVEEIVEDAKVEIEQDVQPPKISDLIGFAKILIENIKQFSTSFDQDFVMPFISSYSEGKRPVPSKFIMEESPFGGDMRELLEILLWLKETDELLADNQSFESLLELVDQSVQAEVILKNFNERSNSIDEDENLTSSNFYEGNSSEFNAKTKWYLDELFSVNLTLQSLKDNCNAVIIAVEQLKKDVNFE